MSDDLTPAHFWYQFWRWSGTALIIAVLCLFALGGLVYGIQQIVFRTDTANLRHQQQVQPIQNSLTQGAANTQQGYVEAITTDVATVDSYIAEAAGAPNAQMMISAAISYGNQACEEATFLTGSYHITDQMSRWISTNCSGGALSPTSLIRSGKGN